MLSKEKVTKMEKMQQIHESGLISEHFPGVSSIVINVKNSYKGIDPFTILRTFNFWTSSHAYFDIECLSKDCINGGFDLNQVITMMIRTHKEFGEGELICDGDSLYSDHSHIYYKVAIQYNTLAVS